MFNIVDLGQVFDVADLLPDEENVFWPFPFPPLPEPDSCGSYYSNT